MAWFDFQPELDELEISSYEDNWVCLDETFSRDELKFSLEERGFKVILGEDY